MKFFMKDFFSKSNGALINLKYKASLEYMTKSAETTDSVTFIEEILNGKLYFFAV